MKYFLGIIVFALLCGCDQTQQHVGRSSPVTAHAVTASAVYSPPLPNPPPTHENALGVINLDAQTAYTVHALAADRVTLYEMFPPEAKFYAINMETRWFWGDGSSTVGSAVSHTYRRAGDYSCRLVQDIGFRGGAVIRVESTCEITVPETTEMPLVHYPAISSLTGISGDPIETINLPVTNTGGREVLVSPKLILTGGTMDNLDWVSISPEQSVIPNNGQPVNFSAIFDWANAPRGQADITIDWDEWLVTRGWNVVYSTGSQQ